MNVYEDDDISVIVPDYLNSDNSLERSSDQLDGIQQEDDSGEDQEVRSDPIDYSDDLDTISSLLADNSEQIIELSVQIDNLNDNLVVFHDDFKTLSEFLFAFVVLYFLHFVFNVINKFFNFDKL